MDCFVLNSAFANVDVIDIFESLLWTERYSSCGDFELYMATNTKSVNLLAGECFLAIGESERVMVVESLEIKSDPEGGSHTIAKGRSLESILDRRIIWTQTTLTGNLQLAIKRLLGENAISPTNTSRKIPGLTFLASTDPAVTTHTVDAQFTGDNLYTAIKDLCDSAGIGFKITLSTNDTPVFQLYSGTNRAYDQLLNPQVTFSPSFENLASSNYFESRQPLKTVTLIGGEGEGSARRYATAGVASGLDRRELFTDARDISSLVDGVTIPPATYLNQLLQRGFEKLAEAVKVSAFDGDADPTGMYVYGQDFFMGDDVQIANEYGLAAASRVTEYIRSHSTSGAKAYPTFTPIET